MSFSPAKWRGHFPLLAAHHDLHYLDNAATGQLCEAALDAVTSHELTHRANVLRGTYRLAEQADAAYENARRQAAAYLNAASAEEVVFTSGTTASINLVAHAFGEGLGAGDEVVLSLAEHHSNFVPWQMLRDRRGNPILWPREFFAPMQAVSGDKGARGLLEENRQRIRSVEMDDDAIHADVDTPADLRGSRP